MKYDEEKKTYIFRENNGEVIIKIEKEICFVLFFKLFIKEESKKDLTNAIQFLEIEAKKRKCKAIAYNGENQGQLTSFLASDDLSEEIKFWFNGTFFYKLIDNENLLALHHLFQEKEQLKVKMKNMDSEENIQIKKITIELPFLMFHFFKESFGVILHTENGHFLVETISNNQKTEKVLCENAERAISEILRQAEKVYKRNRLFKLFEIEKPK